MTAQLRNRNTTSTSRCEQACRQHGHKPASPHQMRELADSARHDHHLHSKISCGLHPFDMHGIRKRLSCSTPPSRATSACTAAPDDRDDSHVALRPSLLWDLQFGTAAQPAATLEAAASVLESMRISDSHKDALRQATSHSMPVPSSASDRSCTGACPAEQRRPESGGTLPALCAQDASVRRACSTAPFPHLAGDCSVSGQVQVDQVSYTGRHSVEMHDVVDSSSDPAQTQGARGEKIQDSSRPLCAAANTMTDSGPFDVGLRGVCHASVHGGSDRMTL